MTGWSGRTRWTDLPGRVRAVIEERLGGRVVGAVVPDGGYGRGLASVLELDRGERVFAKAVPDRGRSADFFRVEMHTAARLPEAVPAPRVVAALETDGWLVLIFEAVAGRHPRLDHPAERAAVFDTVGRMAHALTPNPLPDISTLGDSSAASLRGWREFATDGPPSDLDPWALRHLDRLAEIESEWTTVTAGNTLLHFDLRPDNMLLTEDGRVVVVDWAWPCRGAAWVDAATLAPCLLEVGVDPEPILANLPLTAGLTPAVIDTFLCALCGYWTHASRLPAPEGAPSLRAYQGRKAELLTTWLARRLGW
ncbi:phosphotransferase family protein [Nocardia pseudobrasiliensis]|uniref:Phosphotransferase family enzyme n=1 Tax=Nocardia pseudobrasiliensis TaxID=45979 RepID=A0A370I406_9NOCA|nr:phosphotransferase [Nocardia pseudobrasiliensis]RDI65467.1 phosphotransferase family enzyme [Nocardia pseudobrasiliensis]